MDLYLGIDFGTSGARAVIINSQEQPCWQIEKSFNSIILKNLATVWQRILFELIEQIPCHIRQKLKRSQSMELLQLFCYAIVKEILSTNQFYIMTIEAFPLQKNSCPSSQ